MKLLLLEYFTAIAARSVDPALRAEGGAMRDALAVDLARLPGADVTVLHRAGQEPPRAPRLSGRPLSQDPEPALAALAGRFDAALLIAPEDGGILERLTRVVRRTGCRLLGPGPEAVRLAADKLLTARLLRAHGITTPETSVLRLDRHTARRLRGRPLPLVLKPRAGCGCQGISRIARDMEIAPALSRLRRAGVQRAALAQESVAGVDASVSLIVFRDGILPLALGLQRLSKKGGFVYRGGSLPYRPPNAPRAIALAVRAAGALAAAAGDLSGFVGVDLVLGREGPVVIEINPRITTSYVGLRHIVQANLGGLILRAGRGDRRPPAPGLRGACDYEAAGRCRLRGRWAAHGRPRRCEPIAAGTSAAFI